MLGPSASPRGLNAPGKPPEESETDISSSAHAFASSVPASAPTSTTIHPRSSQSSLSSSTSSSSGSNSARSALLSPINTDVRRPSVEAYQISSRASVAAAVGGGAVHGTRTSEDGIRRVSMDTNGGAGGASHAPTRTREGIETRTSAFPKSAVENAGVGVGAAAGKSLHNSPARRLPPASASPSYALATGSGSGFSFKHQYQREQEPMTPLSSVASTGHSANIDIDIDTPITAASTPLSSLSLDHGHGRASTLNFRQGRGPAGMGMGMTLIGDEMLSRGREKARDREKGKVREDTGESDLFSTYTEASSAGGGVSPRDLSSAQEGSSSPAKKGLEGMQDMRDALSIPSPSSSSLLKNGSATRRQGASENGTLRCRAEGIEVWQLVARLASCCGSAPSSSSSSFATRELAKREDGLLLLSPKTLPSSFTDKDKARNSIATAIGSEDHLALDHAPRTRLRTSLQQQDQQTASSSSSSSSSFDINSRIPPLILDTRSHADYCGSPLSSSSSRLKGHFAYSVNINLPSLVVKRLKRFSANESAAPARASSHIPTSNSSGTTHEESSSRSRSGSLSSSTSETAGVGIGIGASSKGSDIAIETFITTSMGKRRFEAIVQRAHQYQHQSLDRRRRRKVDGKEAEERIATKMEVEVEALSAEQQAKPQLWEADIVVVYDDVVDGDPAVHPFQQPFDGSGGVASANSSGKANAKAAAEAGQALLRVLERTGPAEAYQQQHQSKTSEDNVRVGGGVYYLHGGFQAAAAAHDPQAAAAAAWICAGSDDAEELPPLLSQGDRRDSSSSAGLPITPPPPLHPSQQPLLHAQSPSQPQPHLLTPPRPKPRLSIGTAGVMTSPKQRLREASDGAFSIPSSSSSFDAEEGRMRSSPMSINNNNGNNESHVLGRSGGSMGKRRPSAASLQSIDISHISSSSRKVSTEGMTTTSNSGATLAPGTFASGVAAGKGSSFSSLAPPDPTGSKTPSVSTPGQRRTPRPALARIDTSEKIKTPATSVPSRSGTAEPRSAERNSNFRPSPEAMGSFQSLCRQQAQQPPSPASFGARSLPPPPPASAVESGLSAPLDINSELRRASEPFSPYRNSADEFKFTVSCILPDFLYLGPDIQSQEDVQLLEGLNVRRILNMAIEIEDGGKSGLDLKGRFDKYLRIPMKDTVEATGVQKSIEEACRFIDDARLHDAPIYVHCKAGKSRSVLAVMAYLIHTNHWTLKRTYAYVVERRNAVSPNIGFVAELMKYEEKELGLKKSKGLLSGPSDEDGDGGTPNGTAGAPPSNVIRPPVRARDSLPALPTPVRMSAQRSDAGSGSSRQDPDAGQDATRTSGSKHSVPAFSASDVQTDFGSQQEILDGDNVDLDTFNSWNRPRRPRSHG